MRRADAEALVRFEELIGTALVLAYLQVTQLMPVMEIEERASAAAKHFEGCVTPFGWDFTYMRITFITLVSPDVLNVRSKWLLRARLWKLILSQNVEGFWDASDTTAFALAARSVSEVKALPATIATRIKDSMRAFFETTGEDEELDFDDIEHVLDAAHETKVGARVSAADELGGVEDFDRRVFDCPLTNHGSAITATMPRLLRQVRDEHAGASVERVWTTMCCVAFLETQPVMWLWGDGDAYYFEGEERTIVDAAREWVERHAAERPALEAAIRDGKLWKRAKRVTRLWRRATETRVAQLRASKAIRSQMNLSHAHRSLVSITRALLTQHETFSTFLSEPLEGLQRWQSACSLTRFATRPAPDEPRCGAARRVDRAPLRGLLAGVCVHPLLRSRSACR